MSTNWQPSWWKKEEHGGGFDRVKEAIRRDWEQTKKDFHAKGGHELNQKVGDTVKQAVGKEAIPNDDRPNPPKVVGNWDDVELPVSYGHGARKQYGADHPKWNDRLEGTLRSEWEAGRQETKREWDDVRQWVKHGYEYQGKN